VGDLLTLRLCNVRNGIVRHVSIAEGGMRSKERGNKEWICCNKVGLVGKGGSAKTFHFGLLGGVGGIIVRWSQSGRNRGKDGA